MLESCQLTDRGEEELPVVLPGGSAGASLSKYQVLKLY